MANSKMLIQSLNELYTIPTTFDVVIGDFGRYATIEYLQLLSRIEENWLVSILEELNLSFYDEYRRIMYSVICDIEYFKRDEIQGYRSDNRGLDEDILVGLGPTGMTAGFIDRVMISVLQQTIIGVANGHKEIRVLIPCNGLYDVIWKVRDIYNSTSEVERIATAFGYPKGHFQKTATANVTFHTLPETILLYLQETLIDVSELLAIGTRRTNQIYQTFAKTINASFRISELEDEEFELIDEAIVASIGSSRSKLTYLKSRLANEVIAPRIKENNNLFVLEACTDFNFGLGSSSVELFAQAMVKQHYQRT